MKVDNKFFGILVLTTALLLGACAKQAGQQSFSTPEAAFDALVAAAEKDDVPALTALLGKGAAELLDSGDPVQDRLDRAAFVTAYHDKHSLQSPDENTRMLVTGKNDSSNPIPAVSAMASGCLMVTRARMSWYTAASAPMNWAPSA